MTLQPDTTQMTQTKKLWRDPSERAAAPAGRRGRSDEFTADVSAAIAALRKQHGHRSISCQPEGNAAEPARQNEIDRLRGDLQELLPGVNRRGFFQLTGAAAVFALAGCYKQHPDTIVPYAQQPEGTTIGKPVFYSSTLRDSGRPVGVMVKTYDGRPIKIEGNPDHPLSRGRADLHTQAALLNLYDPDRLQAGPRRMDAGKPAAVSWQELDAAVGAALKTGGIGLVTGAIDGPANRALIDEFKAAFGDRVRHLVLDGGDVWERALRGTSLVWRADRAALMVTVGGDFVGTAGLAEQVEFGDFRRARGDGKSTDMGQLIAFEATMSQTGIMADVRVRVAADRLAWVGWGIAEIVAKALGVALPDGVADQLAHVRAGKPLAEALGLKPAADGDAIEFAAKQLLAVKAAGKHSLVYPGATLANGQHAVPVYQAAYFLNTILGNEGVTVDGAAAAPSAVAGIAVDELRQALDQGKISTLIVSGCNPLYAMPSLAPSFAKAKTIVVLDDRVTETGAAAHFVAPTLHGLESWGDAEARAGIYSLQQPTILPLWDCRAVQESLIAFAVAAGVAPASFRAPVGKPDANLLSAASRKPLWQPAPAGLQSWQAYLKAVWLGQVRPKAKTASDERAFWNGALARGVVVVAAGAPAAPFSAAKVVLATLATGDKLSLSVRASRAVGDGTWLNNPWLQEIPDPISKITWDNYLAVSPADAAAKGLAENDVVKLTVAAGPDSASVQLPVHIQEGQQPGVLETFSGWGRAKGRAGAVADLGVDHGFSVDATAIAAVAANPAAVVSLEKTGATYQIACTQSHQRMDGRELAADDVLELHRADPGARKRKAKRELWENGQDGKADGHLSAFGSAHAYVGHRWGMSVDTTTCIGCNACVVACSAENNVPVVGRDEVRNQRLMHWIRIDRYYSSGAEDTDMLDVEAMYLPVMCQQCGNAPCEEVCPAMATMHNDEGVNVMVYNRCIGTRYCSNNCPYKVRRFNWYEYSKYRAGPVGSESPVLRIGKHLVTEGATSSQAELSQHPLEMMLNPEITVRSRGVMEKCNFCLQRTREVREREKALDQRLPDGAVTTACAQTCPTQAIVFGDLADPAAQVTRLAATVQGYKLLDEELNTRPAVTYQTKLRNRPATSDERKALATAIAAKPAAATGGQP